MRRRHATNCVKPRAFSKKRYSKAATASWSIPEGFFFQAEVGIRDGHVTGVQTCALPICALAHVAGVACIALASPRAAHCSHEAGSSAAISVRTFSEQVDIYRDSFGVPYIFAVTDKGAYFGAGYAAASDRLFQMCSAR